MSKDRRNLASLYPEPKSYADRQRERLIAQQALAERQKGRPVLFASVSLYILFALLVFIMGNVPGLIQFDAFAGVFISFFLAMSWAGLAYWAGIGVSSRLAAMQLSARSFLVMYMLSMIPQLGLIIGRSAFFIEDLYVKIDAASYIFASFMHFIFVYVILKTFMSNGSSGLSRMGAILMLSVVTSVLFGLIP